MNFFITAIFFAANIYLINSAETAPRRISSDFIIDDSNSDEFDDFNVQTSYIEKGFTNSRSFGCGKVKSLLQTGTNVGNISPEDIDIVATMGDAIATGMGLWPGTDVEFRGAVFTTGGDANIDGLPTVSRKF
uniref:Uncharacterized protein n=1 Tax=Panagrolaimus sp. PS1159 TaxID=55785 RepID=A0AC35GPU8_9BILA